MNKGERRLTDIGSWRKILDTMKQMGDKVMKESEDEYSCRREERRDEIVKWLDNVAKKVDSLRLEPIPLRVGMDRVKLLFWGWYAVAGGSPQYSDWRFIPDRGVLEKRKDGALLWRASQDAWRLSYGRNSDLPDDLVENWDAFQSEIYDKVRQMMRKMMDDEIERVRSRLSKLERLNGNEDDNEKEETQQ
jgi:hypothetical protein